MLLEIKHTLTQEETEAIYRLRYDVYIEEMGYEQKHACHKNKLLPDPMDISGDLFGAFEKETAIGTCLTNYTRTSDLTFYPTLYNMDKLAQDYKQYASISTKLIVHKNYRKGPVVFKLVVATYVKGLRDGIKYNFIDCEPNLVQFYSRLGYIVHLPEIHHPEFGPGVVMVLELENEAVLKKSKSPLLKYLLSTKYS